MVSEWKTLSLLITYLEDSLHSVNLSELCRLIFGRDNSYSLQILDIISQGILEFTENKYQGYHKNQEMIPTIDTEYNSDKISL